MGGAVRRVYSSATALISVAALGAVLTLPLAVFAAVPTASIEAINPGTSVDAGTSVSFSVTTSDLTAPIVFTVSDSFVGTTITSTNINDSTGDFTWTPAVGDIGVHTITVTATGVEGPFMDSETITVLDPAVANVANESELRAALLNPAKTSINITADISGITQTVIVDRAVTINGGGHTLSFTGLEVAAPNDDGLAIVAPATVNDLVVNAGLATPTAWVSTYGINVYFTTATLHNITVLGGNGGMYLRDSTVALTGSIDVSGNGFGGIEAKGPTSAVDVSGATFTNSTEAYGLPTIWEDGLLGTTVVNYSPITRVIKGAQYQYYLVETNSRQPQTITFTDPADQVYGDATSIVLAPTSDSSLPVVLDVSGDCSIVDYTVNFTNAGTCTVTASQAGDATYAPATNVVQSFTIAPRAITVNATAINKVYDTANTSAGIPTLFAGTLASGDTATYSQTYASTDVANGIVLTALATINGNAANPNYAITYSTATGNITPATLTATATAEGKVYDGSTDAVVSLLVSPLGDDDVNAVYTDADFDTKDTGPAKVVTVTGITLTGDEAGNYALANTTALASAVVTPKALTAEVTVSNKVYDNTTVATITGYTPVGLVGGEVVTINGGTATFDSEHVEAGKEVTVTGLLLVADSVSANYSFTDSDSTIAEITARPITVTAQTDTRVYDATTDSSVVPLITSGTLAPDDYEEFSQSFDTADVGTGKTLTAEGVVDDGNDGDNYTVTFEDNFTGEITKKALIITADDLTKVYGDANPTPTASYDGFEGADDETDLDVDVTLVVVANDQTDVNNHPITALGASDSNYEITHENGNLEITKRLLSVTVAADSKVYDGTVAGNASLTVNDILFADDVNAVFTSAEFDTKDVGTDKTVTVSGIVLGGADAGNYSIDSFEVGTADITVAPLAVNAIGTTKVYGDVDPVLTYTSTGLVSGDSFTGDLERVSGEDVDSYAINIGTLSAGSNYGTVAFSSANLEITPASLTVTADNKSKTYGDANPALTISYGPFKNGDDEGDLDTEPTASTLAVNNSNAGAWAITPGDGVSDNYSFAYVDGTLTIVKADQTITFGALADKNFGDADFLVSATSGSSLDVSFTSTGACTVTGNSVHLDTKGICTITASQSGDSNWNGASAVSQSFEIHDVTAPIITLTGGASITQDLQSQYVDLGAIALDDVDGVVAVNVVSTVDTSVEGVYTVTYTSVDSEGNSTTPVVRTVSVLAAQKKGGNGGGGSSGGSGGSTGGSAGNSNTTTPKPSSNGSVLGASTYNFTTDMTIGSTGNDVMELQKRLRALGFFTYPTDTGYFGPLTQAAVKLYQASKGIITTGYVGPLTRGALNSGI